MPFIRGRGRSNHSAEVQAAQARAVEQALEQTGGEMTPEVENYLAARVNPPNRRGGNPNNPNAGFREGGTRTKIPQNCVDAASTMRFESNQARLDFLSDCAASNADDTENTSSVEATGTATGTGNYGNPKRDLSSKALSNTTLIIVIGLAAAGIYLAYNRGLFKSNNI